jgi:cytochrome P450
LPLTVIAEQLGVSREDLPSFRRWSDAIVAQLGQQADRDAQIASARMLVEFQHYFAARLEERRGNSREDILSDIANARFEDERPLDVAECLSILNQLLVAGNETTANAITEGMWLLVQHPEQQERVAARPELLPNLVEEVVRLSTTVANMWRRTSEDTKLEGVEIPKGSFVMLRFHSANRDEQVFPDPDSFDPERENAADHLAFGHGIHFCLGAPLARLELNIAFRTLLGGFKDWRACPDSPPSQIVPNMLLRGRDALNLRFSAR